MIDENHINNNNNTSKHIIKRRKRRLIKIKLRKIVMTTEKLILKGTNINGIKSILREKKDGKRHVILILETAILADTRILQRKVIPVLETSKPHEQ